MKPVRRNALFELGAAYYPDYVPASGLTRRSDGTLATLAWEDRLQEDFLRMKRDGLHIIRMGEFSWSWVEPRRGEFCPERFDRALDLAQEHGIQVLFCTPTTTPPKWLIDEHPDILPVTRTGARIPFGSRRHYDVHNPDYQRESDRIVSLYADRWGRHPAVVGWQTDNEYGCHGSVFLFTAHARAAFQAWLNDKYAGKIESLNADWFTSFWSQRYTEFGQIELPFASWTDQNPSLELDFRRFSNGAWRAFQARQVDILRERSPGRLLTHNFMTNFSDLCPWTLSADLDVAGYDHYQMEPVPHPLTSHHDFALMASLRRKRFWVLEQQPPQVNWQAVNRRFAPDWLFLWGAQSAFLGARGMMYFSWQRMYGGPEQYHDGVVPHDLRVEESTQEKILRAKNLFFRQLENRMGLTELPSQEDDVLCIHGMESLWSHEITAQSTHYTTRKQLDWVSSLCTRLGWGMHLAPSVESARERLSRYRVVILPGTAFEFTTLEREALRRFVDSGGKVLSLPRTAMKQRNNQMSSLPLSIFSATDFHFEEHGALLPGEREVCEFNEGPEFQGALWAEKIVVSPAAQDSWQAVARFKGGLYSGSPAILRNATFSQGGVWAHLAVCPLASDDFFHSLAQVLGEAPRVANITPTPAPFEPGPQTEFGNELQGAVQCIALKGSGRSFLGVVNFGRDEAKVTLGPNTRTTSVLWARIDEGSLALASSFWQGSHTQCKPITVTPRGVALLEIEI